MKNGLNTMQSNEKLEDLNDMVREAGFLSRHPKGGVETPGKIQNCEKDVD